MWGVAAGGGRGGVFEAAGAGADAGVSRAAGSGNREEAGVSGGGKKGPKVPQVHLPATMEAALRILTDIYYEVSFDFDRGTAATKPYGVSGHWGEEDDDTDEVWAETFAKAWDGFCVQARRRE